MTTTSELAERLELRRRYLESLAWVRRRAETELRRVIGTPRCPTCKSIDPCFVHCYTCGVDCTIEEVAHADHCPAAYGLERVSEDEVYLHEGIRCSSCEIELKPGETYYSRPMKIRPMFMDGEHPVFGDAVPLVQIFEPVCIGCAASTP